MIAFLRGRVAAVGDDHLVLDVNGVGYLVHTCARTLQRLPRTGETVELWIETIVREDAILLYGFLEPAERAWFRLLQTVQGVGAKLALQLLGRFAPDELATAIAARDRVTLARAPGVGLRLAGRLVAELAERVAEMPRTLRTTEPATEGAGEGPAAEALAALLRLGFPRAEALSALARARGRLGETASLEALLREGLKELAPP
ncbi:MAG: Holliday junction branch migration protein RuvA [Geminicoccaceae bacterium]|nr:Holliday junction branch migration protein RuvA [Geminicoccaceae bacterium]MCX7628745.1 Holliday junction branch migration protein RuvA [Geminicoccaceae bacterium]MDW8123351.1 Holliday junction branch migration protein RuvA [Geminicoccaceae bacterium]MDW8341561.1 Holliday junction branch migration protein RuvA [Geminicoccaceae bacterium]